MTSPVISIDSTRTGYLLATTMGNVYNLNTPWYGSFAGVPFLPGISGIASDPDSPEGYWLISPYRLIISLGNLPSYNPPPY